MSAPTISQVAKEAGISVATVSRVINQKGGVTPETTEKVLQAIQRLGYQPNVWGRNLRRGESRMVLVMVPNVSNQYYAPIIAGAEDTLSAAGYDTANALFYGNVDLSEDLDASLDAIRYFHLKDKGGERTVWDFPALGKGWIDFPMIFKQLEQAGDNSPFSIEIEFTQAGSKNLEEVNQAVRDSAEYLKAHGFEL